MGVLDKNSSKGLNAGLFCTEYFIVQKYWTYNHIQSSILDYNNITYQPYPDTRWDLYSMGLHAVAQL